MNATHFSCKLPSGFCTSFHARVAGIRDTGRVCVLVLNHDALLFSFSCSLVAPRVVALVGGKDGFPFQ